MSYRVKAPAKINLSLRITGKRADGYHELVTRMQKIDLFDLLELELTDTGSVEFFSDSREIPGNDSNLAVRAARRFFECCREGSAYGLRIRLTKIIPVGAGLGGGSSDAAAVLKALSRMLGDPLANQELLDIGRELGADVPFLISDHVAVIATGIGDRLKETESLDRYHYVLVNPGFKVNTTWVYENYRLTKEDNNFNLWGSRNSEFGSFSAADLHNDLEQVTGAHYPVIGQIKKRLLQEGASGTLMSGSGPTVFGLFEDGKMAGDALARLKYQYGEEKFRIISAKALDGV